MPEPRVLEESVSSSVTDAGSPVCGESPGQPAPGEPIPLHLGLDPVAAPAPPAADTISEHSEETKAAQGEKRVLCLACLRAQVASGTYRPTAEEIARAMVEHAIG